MAVHDSVASWTQRQLTKFLLASWPFAKTFLSANPYFAFTQGQAALPPPSRFTCPGEGPFAEKTASLCKVLLDNRSPVQSLAGKPLACAKSCEITASLCKVLLDNR